MTVNPSGVAYVIVAMGVSASGKTSVGMELAERLGWPFQEGDELHPPANIAKMSAGEPLNDTDRAPWLDAVAKWIGGRLDDSSRARLSASSTWSDGVTSRGLFEPRVPGQADPGALGDLFAAQPGCAAAARVVLGWGQGGAARPQEVG